MTIFEPSLDLQKGIRARLLASADLMALVPADNVLDSTGRPERMPAVGIGEGQTVYRRFNDRSTAIPPSHPKCWCGTDGRR
jgi:hypothetical protein